MDESFCPWSEKYVTRIPAFDEQHREIFDLLNRLGAAVKEGRGNLYELFVTVLESYRKHVKTEEDLLAVYNYIGLDKQKKDHAKFLKELETIEASLRTKEKALTLDTLARVRNDITGHILGADRAYGEFLKSAGLM